MYVNWGCVAAIAVLILCWLIAYLLVRLAI